MDITRFWRRRPPQLPCGPALSDGPGGSFLRLQQGLEAYGMPVREEYDQLARRYDDYLCGAVEAALDGAQLVTPSRDGSPGTHEVVAWRLDADNSDGEFNFATRMQLLASSVGSAALAPAGILVSRQVSVGRHTAAPVKDIFRKGLYVQELGYGHYPLKVQAVASKFPSSYTTFHNNLKSVDDTNKTYWQSYGVDMQSEDKEPLVRFPVLPAYETVRAAGYAAFCNDKTSEAPTVRTLAEHLDEAAERDASNQGYVTDNLPRYSELSRYAPSDTSHNIRRLTEALYARDKGRPLSPELTDALLHPDAALHAQLASLNKGTYIRRLEGRRYTSPLTHQLAVVAELVTHLQLEVYPVMHADRAGYVGALLQSLEPVVAAVDEARLFHDHISLPTTFEPCLPDWTVVPR